MSEQKSHGSHGRPVRKRRIREGKNRENEYKSYSRPKNRRPSLTERQIKLKKIKKNYIIKIYSYAGIYL